MQVHPKNDPTAAVIIPTYNRGVMATQALQSVLDQSRPPEQVVVVDDGSTDDTASLIGRFGDRVRYIYQRNAGKSAALNHAIAELDVDYVWIMDDDDIALPNALENHLSYLGSHPEVDFTYSGCYQFKGESPPVALTREMLDDSYREPEASNFLIWCLTVFPFFMQGMLVPMRCYRSVGGFDESLLRGQDYDMIIRLARIFLGGKLDRPTFLLRVHEGDRGPAHHRQTANERHTVWRQYDEKIFGKVHSDFALPEYLPRGSTTEDFSTGQRRRALLQRACIMARRGLFVFASEDLRAAIKTGSMAAYTAEEQLICTRMMDIDPELLRNGRHFIRDTRQLLHQCGHRLTRDFVKGLSWSFKRELNKHDYRAAARVLIDIIRLVGLRGTPSVVWPRT